MVGLTLALTGSLTPLASAILMPVSSLTIVGMSSGGVRWAARRVLPRMSVVVLLIAAGGLVAGGFLGAFLWAVRSGQFDDVETPPSACSGTTTAASSPMLSKDARTHDHD